MDNLTHALVGAALARTGLDRRTPLATTTLVLAANAPDVDVLAYANGPYYALAFRRGITHGLPAMIVLPFAVTGVMLLCDRWRRRRPGAEPARAGALLLLSVIGLLTHPALDWMNTYGMRWWLPLDGSWSYGDSLFIIDPWLWALLGAAAFLGRPWGPPGLVLWGVSAAAASALVLAGPTPVAAKGLWTLIVLALATLTAARRPPGPEAGRLAARTLTGLALLYVGAMVGLDQLARRDALAAARAAGVEGVAAVMVAPLPADPLGAEVLLLTPDGYLRGDHRWTRSPRVELGGPATPLRAGEPAVGSAAISAAVAAALTQADARHYLTWSRFPYFHVAASPTGWRVTISDARYDGRGTGSLGGVQVDVSREAVGGRAP